MTTNHKETTTVPYSHPTHFIVPPAVEAKTSPAHTQYLKGKASAMARTDGDGKVFKQPARNIDLINRLMEANAHFYNWSQPESDAVPARQAYLAEKAAYFAGQLAIFIPAAKDRGIMDDDGAILEIFLARS